MIKRVIARFVVVVMYTISLPAFSQSNDTVDFAQREVTDSLAIKANSDTVAWVNDKVEIGNITSPSLKNTKPFKPDPNRAVIYSAIFPGLGQFYNKKYWKLPIVYGGFIGLVYALSWNGKHYNDYTNAYRAIMNENRLQPGYIEKWVYFLNAENQANVNNMTAADLTRWQDRFKRQRDTFRRNRDLSIIGVVALYALCMIDAYVDAQLFDFDLSPDLSFRVEPKVGLDVFSQKTFGLQCSVKF